MDAVITYFESLSPVVAALLATTFTWLVTAFGASFVFFFKNMKRSILDASLGFTGGVMIAASFWSLLSPAIEMSKGEGFIKAFPAVIGFAVGALFLFGLDKIIPHLHLNTKEEYKEGSISD